MQIQYTDFNENLAKFSSEWKQAWDECADTLKEMPLHLKVSDQAGRQGSAIFDPVGTNEYIKAKLKSLGWASNVPIPAEFSFLGTDVDFVKDEIITEVQFSNYPFLLNNVIRSEFFVKSGSRLSGNATAAVIIITKAHMFPASNSTLYYEQGVKQLTALAGHNVFDAPIRLVGLFEEKGSVVSGTWTTYENPRYSRTVVSRETVDTKIQPPRTVKGRCRIVRN